MYEATDRADAARAAYENALHRASEGEDATAVIFEAGDTGGIDTSLFVCTAEKWDQIQRLYDEASETCTTEKVTEDLGVWLRMPYIVEVGSVTVRGQGNGFTTA